MPRKKVFVLSHNYPQNEHDMAGIFIKNILADLSADFEFGVCPIRFGETMHKLYRNPLKWPELAGFYFAAAKIAAEEFAKDRYDLIWAHWWLPPGIIAARLSRKSGTPLLVTCHGTDAFMLRDLKILRPLATRVFKTARIVNVVSEYMASITTPASVVANMPYNQELFYYQGSPKDDRYIICPSAFIKRKNLDILIKAAGEVPEIKLKIFGSGILREHLQNLAEEVPNISIQMSLSQKDLAAEYRKAGAVILPSINEGFGLTLAEGAACGCFTLATSDGGMVEIVRQTGGIIFPHDPGGEEIKKALQKYLESLPVDRAKIAQSAGIYSRERIIPRFKEILQKALSV